MNNPLIDVRDLNFVLFEMLKVDELVSFEKFSSLDRATFDATLDLIEKLTVNECYPHYSETDKTGCTFNPKDGSVTIPDGIKIPLKKYYEAGFLGIAESPEIGGMGMPVSIGAAHMEFVSASHQTLIMYPALAHGAMMLVAKFGSEELKSVIIPKVMNGEWGGTMCLTEPQAGSDVGRLETKAVKQADGTYRITGKKIFISAGENDYYSNMIHPVLARIVGDPDGTKGISIFIVPKYLWDKDGNLGKKNDLSCSGIEHKMGIKGCSTCSMNFGDNDECVGYLLGAERSGMKIMFHMMNEFRMATATQAQSISSAAYLIAASYAKGRLQGAAVKDMANPSAPMTHIVNHPDVARMLLWMKSYVDAQRMLIYYMYHNMDLVDVLSDDEKKKEASALIDFLVPLCKGGCSDMNMLITSESMQIFGGHGYCSDYPVEQLMRNSKILCLLEGTNGIQGMDLIMRKLLMNKDQFNYKVFSKRIQETIDSALKNGVDKKYVDPVVKAMDSLDKYIAKMKEWGSKFMFAHILSKATPFRKAVYMVAIAWMHLWSMSIAIPKLKSITGDKSGAELNSFIADNNDAAFYHGKILASRFFISDEFPQFFGIIDSLYSEDWVILDATPDAFTGTIEM